MTENNDFRKYNNICVCNAPLDGYLPCGRYNSTDNRNCMWASGCGHNIEAYKKIK